MMSFCLRAPFPYFGTKRKAAPLIWPRLGKVDRLIIPFFGSGGELWAADAAVFDRRAPMDMVLNDVHHHIANFWRAVKAEPEKVAEHCCWPTNETDLHARHQWLVYSDDGRRHRERMYHDPDYYDARIAGWWCWGQSCWIGGGWCEESGTPGNRRPSSSACGVVRRRDLVGAERTRWMRHWFAALSGRLQSAIVCCGDWTVVVASPSCIALAGTCGIIMDPPYTHYISGRLSRTRGMYTHDSGDIAARVRTWCVSNQDNPLLRIALCGHEGEHDELEARGWSVVGWVPDVGMSSIRKRETRGVENRKRERIWFSPHCLPTTLFE